VGDRLPRGRPARGFGRRQHRAGHQCARVTRPAVRAGRDWDGQADGSSRKPDHDRVNQFLNRVADELYTEIARRFDPTVDDGELLGTADNFAEFQIIPTWSEIAWRNAERLVSAPSAQTRAQVADAIEAYAASQAQTLRSACQYGPLGSSAARDAYCATHHG
jgi:Family of unknown function (DUF5995)